MTTLERPPVTIPDHTAFFTSDVLWVKHWNEHLFSFAITRPASFRFRSGEFIMVGLPTEGGKPLMRAYSISSPDYAEELEFLSIKVEDGPLTSRLQLIQPGDQMYLGRKPVGTLVTDALLPGKRLFMFSTGTGLAPFLSLMRDPQVYDLFEQVVVVHSVRRVSDLAYHEVMTGNLSDDPLVSEQAEQQFHYIPTVTREPFHTSKRIGALIEDGTLFSHPLGGADKLDPETDRVMMCGSTAMIHEMGKLLETLGFEEGSNSKPGTYVIERAFVD